MRHYKKFLTLATGCCLFGTTSAMAAVSSADLENAIQKINSQTAALQQEVKELKAELRAVKRSKQAKSKQVLVAEASVSDASSQTAPKTLPANSTIWSVPEFMASPVLNASFLNPSTDLDPSGFLSFQAGMDQGLFLLKQRKALEDQQKAGNLPFDDRPQVKLGGKLEGQAAWQSPYSGTNSSSVDLVTAELEVSAQVSSWAAGELVIDYNNASLNQVLFGSGNPINNSNLFLNRGYIALGNLNKTPIYFNIGQMFTPFGAYTSNMLTNPTTKVLGRTNSRVAELGFFKDGFNTSVYAFDGAANTTRGNPKLDNWGANASYRFSFGPYSARFGAGYINDISSAQGAQLTGGGEGTFQGFSDSSATETLVHYVPGVDVNAMLSRGPWYLAAEGVEATRKYDPADMFFNNAGAQPRAIHLETGVDFDMLGKKSIFSVAYDQTWQALAMGLPKNSYTATFNTSLWKNTVETLEFRHDVNYASTDMGGGRCAFVDSDGTMVTDVCLGPVAPGGKQNTVLAQIGLYF